MTGSEVQPLREQPARGQAAESLPGNVRLRSARTGLGAWVQYPAELPGSIPPLVIVHGVGRNRRLLFETFAPWCLELGIPLIAPRFSRSRFRGYQRCESGAAGVSADDALSEILCLALGRSETLAPEDLPPLRVFGFSGGAQFAHRWVLRNERLAFERLALCAPGYFSLPRLDVEYPVGLATGNDGPFASGQGGLGLDAERLARVATRVFVGTEDTARDADLRTSWEIDRLQGGNRVERAHSFVQAMRSFSCSRGLYPHTTLRLLEGGRHSFRSCVDAGLDREVMRFLYPELMS